MATINKKKLNELTATTSIADTDLGLVANPTTGLAKKITWANIASYVKSVAAYAVKGTTGIFTNLTDGILPYHKNDTDGLADSVIHYNSATGAVGVGAAPSGSTRLQVSGNIITSIGSGGTLKLFDSDAVKQNQLVLASGVGGGQIYTTYATGGDLTLKINTVGGNVAVGNITPPEKLSVGGNVSLPKTSGAGIKVEGAYGWKDLACRQVPKAAGAGVPAAATYIGSIELPSWGTTAGVNAEHWTAHLDHDYAPGTDVYVHEHWSVISTATGNVNFLFDATYAKGYNQAQFPTPITVSVTQAVIGTAYTHQIAEVQLSAPGGLIASAVNVSISAGAAILTAASSLFTAGDIGRTVRILGAGPGGAALDTTISGYTSATQVTLTNNATTTVTTQPYFNYRVLNSDLLEVDGLIQIRVWRDASRAADTLDQAPFGHTLDLHYQSTDFVTKNKNYPFYS